MSEVSVADNRRKWIMLVVVVLSTFMSALDTSIVNVALPAMAKQMDVTTSQIQLVATSYLIMIAGTILIFGKLGDLSGKAKFFEIGLFIFVIGSLMCSLSNTFYFLIFSRIVQAIGAAGLMANNQGLVTEIFPKAGRGQALGVLGTFVALGSLVGPGLGGLIVGFASWQYIFWINIPVGILDLILAIILLPRGEKKHEGSLDWTGAILFMVSIVPLFLALEEGISLGFTNPLVLGGFAVSIIAFAVFLYVEYHKSYPLLDLSMFSNRLFSLSIFCGYISFVVIMCNNFILPFYLEDARSFEPQKAGYILMVYPLILAIVAPIGGRISDKIGSEFLTLLGLAFISVGLFLMSTLTLSSPITWIVCFVILMAFGMGLFQSPNNSLVMSTVKPSRLGIAGSTNALVRNIGMVCGIALATTLLYSMMSLRLGRTVTTYIEGESGAFIYGMHIVYIAAGVICAIGAIMTLIRMLTSKKENKDLQSS